MEVKFMECPSDHEIFDAVAHNNIKRVREMLDMGVNINIREHDHKCTPLQVAAARGSRQAVEFLVQRGADINAQDDRGSTALHSLVFKRFDLLALWMVRQGADLHIKDRKNFSPRDFALDWFQKELDEALKKGKVADDADEPAPGGAAETKK